MALPKRSSLSPPQNASTRDLKQRVITCLNKLSDRDTHGIAITELESIVRNLRHDSFSPFLNCIYYTDPSQKSPVRKQCARLLGFVSEIHGDDLSPFVSKMLANIVRRLRDSDTAVRSACVDAVSTMARYITKPPFSVFLKPLMEAVALEQDQNSQIGSSLCLASAIEASPDLEVAQLQRFLPKLMKLLKSEAFKAKPALLLLIGSIVGTGSASSQNVLVSLIPCLVEFLSSEDWAARKAAAEVFERLAVVERDILTEFKSSLLPTFESRRFDKVKVVRDTMNRMLEAWKDVPDVADDVWVPAESKSSSKENASDGRYPPRSKGACTKAIESPPTRKFSRSPTRPTPPDRSSAMTVRQQSPLKSSDSESTPAMFRKLNRNKPANWKVEISAPYAPPLTSVCQDDLKGRERRVPESEGNQSSWRDKVEAKRTLFSRNSDDTMNKFGGLKSGSRVVPLHQDESLASTVVVNNNAKDLNENHKTSEDLSLIRKQLLQIENQQSSLLDLLQKFMGSSQNGLRSLETRVHGLEMALDEISYDLAVSTGRLSNPDTAGNACCKLPGSEFLSSKFWRKTEDRYSTSRLSSSLGTPSRTVMRNMADREGNAESFKLENRRFRIQGGGFVVNPLAAGTRAESIETSESHLSSLPKMVYNSEGRKLRNASGLDMTSPIVGGSQTGTSSRLAAS